MGLALAVLAACARGESSGANPGDVSGETTADSTTPAAQRPPADTAWESVGQPFDPRRARIGDSVGALRIDTIDVRDAIEGEIVGMARFAGRLALEGRTMAHPDYPDWSDPCVEIDLESARQIPRWRGDRRRPWFCFENREVAKRAIGDPLPRRPVAIVVDRYTIHVNLSDAVNEARLLDARLLDADSSAARRP